MYAFSTNEVIEIRLLSVFMKIAVFIIQGARLMYGLKYTSKEIFISAVQVWVIALNINIINIRMERHYIIIECQLLTYYFPCPDTNVMYFFKVRVERLS